MCVTAIPYFFPNLPLVVGMGLVGSGSGSSVGGDFSRVLGLGLSCKSVQDLTALPVDGTFDEVAVVACPVVGSFLFVLSDLLVDLFNPC